MQCHGWSIQSNVKSVSFSTNHWFVCIADLCILETWSVRSMCGRIYCELAFAPNLRISLVYSRGSVFAKNSRWWGYRAFDCPYVAYSKLFGSLLSMLVDQPLYFKATRTTLTNPSVGELTYPFRVTLLVWRVSGNPLSSAGFSTEVADVTLSAWRKKYG